MKKNCANPTCEKLFEPKTAKAAYCSDSCRVAGNRAKKNSITSIPIVKELINAVDGVTTANKIPPPKKKKDPEVVVEAEYGPRFLELCKAKNISPEDMLVWIEENYGKKPAPLKSVFGKKEKEPRHDGTRYDRRKSKMGF